MENDIFIEKSNELLDLQLALELYDLNMDQANEFMNKLIEKLNDYRTNREKRTTEENIKIIDELIKEHNQFINFIGKDHFIFHEDGGINYIWRDIKHEL